MATTPAPRRHQASVAELVANRAEVRRALMQRFVYTNIGDTDLSDGGQRRFHLYALNLVVGHHLERGATAVRELGADTLQLLMTLLNAFAHTTHAKTGATAAGLKQQQKTRDKHAADMVTTTTAATTDPGNDAAAAATAEPPKKKARVQADAAAARKPVYGGYVLYENLRGKDDATVIVGVRLWFCIYAKRTLALSAASAQPDDTTPPVASTTREPCPLSDGFLQSCGEVRAIRALIAKREQQQQQRARMHVDSPQLARPEQTPAYMYAAFDTPTQLVFGPFHTYFAPGTIGVLDAKAAAESAHADDVVIDPRNFLAADLSARAWDDVNTPHYYPYDQHFALRHLLTPAQAMVYFTASVAAEQCDLGGYFPHLSLTEPPQDQDSDYGDDDDDNDPTLRLLRDMNRVDDDDGGRRRRVVPARAFRLGHWLHQLPALHSGANMPLPKWPFPTTTYRVLQSALYPELFSQLVLAHPMVEPPPHASSLEHGLAKTPIFNGPLYARSILILREIEDRERRSATVLTADQKAAAQCVTYDVSPECCAKLDNAKVAEVLLRERNIVQLSVNQLEQEAASRTYAPLLRVTPAHESTADAMGTLDFLSGTQAERLRGRTASTRERHEWETRVSSSVRKQLEAEGHETANIDAIVANAIAAVDALDPDFVARDDFLQLRREVQYKESTMRARYGEGIQRVRHEPNAAELLATLEAEYREDSWRLREEYARVCFNTLCTSDNIPDALRGSFRQWFLANANETAVQQSLDFQGRRAPVQVLPLERPLSQALQFLHDTLRDYLHASSQAYGPALLGFFCVFDAHYYKPGRSNPATNLLYAGSTGIGKYPRVFVIFSLVK